MFNIVLRALCEGDEKLLFLEEPIDPQTSIVRLEDTSPAFTQKYLSSFREPLPEDESQAVLQDRIDTGWLAWGKEMEVSRMPRWDEQTWNPEPSCHAGMSIIEEAIKGKDFWQTVSSSFYCISHGVDCRSPTTGRRRIHETTLQPRTSTSSSP